MFYAGDPQGLLGQIERAYREAPGPGLPPEPAGRSLPAPRALVLPHAGYPYSGRVAARGFSWLAGQGRPEGVVLVGPDHRVRGPPVAISQASSWRTPLGEVPVAVELVRELEGACSLAEPDERAHAEEHSIEVMLPFLQALWGEGSPPPILPLVMGSQALATGLSLGRALARVAGGRGLALLASSDLSHYFPRETALRLDGLAIEAILSGDPVAVAETASREGINMCGPGPVVSILEAARRLGLERRRLLARATSGDVTGDHTAVVGYASLAIG